MDSKEEDPLDAKENEIRSFGSEESSEVLLINLESPLSSSPLAVGMTLDGVVDSLERDRRTGENVLQQHCNNQDTDLLGACFFLEESTTLATTAEKPLFGVEELSMQSHFQDFNEEKALLCLSAAQFLVPPMSDVFGDQLKIPVDTSCEKEPFILGGINQGAIEEHSSSSVDEKDFNMESYKKAVEEQKSSATCEEEPCILGGIYQGAMEEHGSSYDQKISNIESYEKLVIEPKLSSTSSSTEVPVFDNKEEKKSESYLADGNVDSIEEEDDRLTALENKVEWSARLATENIDTYIDCFNKVCEEISASHIKMRQDIKKNKEELVSDLRTINLLDKPDKTKMLDHLEACFNGSGHWIQVVNKSKRLNDIQENAKDYLDLQLRGRTVVKEILGSLMKTVLPENAEAEQSERKNDLYLVKVTSVKDPGEFHVVRCRDLKERNKFFTDIQYLAPTFPVPDKIVLGQKYAVLNSGLKWYRGIAGKECGTYGIGDGPPENLYEFFLPDQGHYEQVTQSKARILPSDLANRPPFALECTLKHYFQPTNNFQPTTWSSQATVFFKQWTARSVMDMKVFDQDGGVLNVDLSQVPNFQDSGNIVSVRDALMLLRGSQQHSSSKTAPNLKYKPKFSPMQLQSNKPKYLKVYISNARSPNNFYVNAIDEEFYTYQQMVMDLSAEFIDATTQSATYVSKPLLGNGYALKYETSCFRVLIEYCSAGRGYESAFYVDTGHRQKINGTMEFHVLPERFRDLPAQAFRCVLDGIYPPTKSTGYMRKGNRHDAPSFSKELISLMNEYTNKSAVAFFPDWIPGDVGRITKKTPKELTAYAIVYLDGDNQSVNVEVGKTAYAQSTRRHDLPEHTAIRLELQGYASSALISANQSTEATMTTESEGNSEISAVNGFDASVVFPGIRDPTVNLQEALKCQTQEAENTSDLRCQTPVSLSLDASFQNGQTSALDITPLFSRDATTCLADGVYENPSVTKIFKDWKLSFEDSGATALANETTADDSSIEELVKKTIPGNEKSFGSHNQKDGFKKKIEDEVKDFHIVAARGTQPREDDVLLPVHFIWCDSPNSLFFRTDEMIDEYRVLNEAMQNEFKDVPPRQQELKFEVGFICAVFCDTKWWRAEVVDLDDFPRCVVSLLDVGYRRTVNDTDIHPLPLLLESSPRLVLHYSLIGVYPPNILPWEEKVCKYIAEQVLGAEKVFVCGERPNSRHTATSVVLYFIADLEGGPMEDAGLTRINLNEELVSLGLASSFPDSRLVRPESDIPTWKHEETSNLKEVFWATVTWVNKKGDIFLQEVGNKKRLEDLCDLLNKKYENTKPREEDLRCQPTNLCIAKYKVDKKWYRGVIDNVRGDDVDVFFVDYGTLDHAAITDIRLDIVPGLVSVPVLAYRCILHDVIPLGGNDAKKWPEKTLNYLHTRTVEKEFRVVVHATTYPLQVSLIDQSNNISIAKDLLSKNYVSRIDDKPGKKKSTKKRKKGSVRK